jgi:hypothetical protein
VLEDEDAQQHRRHLARDGDRDEREGAVEGESGEDEELADRAGQAEEKDVEFDRGVGADEGECGRELVEVCAGYSGDGKEE